MHPEKVPAIIRLGKLARKADKNMGKFKVTFLPDHKEIEVKEGVTLLEAAELAGVYINSLCGGQGLCGECRLHFLTTERRQFELTRQ